MASVPDSANFDIDSGDNPLARPPAVKPYEPERQRDTVRMFVTLGLLASFLWLIFWACRQSINSATVWAQTKNMLQIILPALTGLLGSVIGFYFGSGAGTGQKNGL